MQTEFPLRLKRIYRQLFKAFGPQHWWPGETPFEVIVGAILTQNTNWGNVEKAIVNLKKARVLTPTGLQKVSTGKLSGLIKPSGYFRVKAKRLKNFVNFLFREFGGSLKRMGEENLADLRPKVLGVNGVGPETADSILLYAFQKPIFVVDAYTRRIFQRHGLISEGATYDEIQRIFMNGLPKDSSLFNEYHALIVKTGKLYCRTTPRCENCPLKFDLKSRR